MPRMLIWSIRTRAFGLLSVLQELHAVTPLRHYITVNTVSTWPRNWAACSTSTVSDPSIDVLWQYRAQWPWPVMLRLQNPSPSMSPSSHLQAYNGLSIPEKQLPIGWNPISQHFKPSSTPFCHHSCATRGSNWHFERWGWQKHLCLAQACSIARANSSTSLWPRMPDAWSSPRYRRLKTLWKQRR